MATRLDAGRRIAAVVGTAGHVDHGKTALVRALTGMETDRLPEEKARGISIELGFAWLDRPAGRIALIDVPGHERFVRQMVAGAAGIDAVVLVVAADEGVMPQTREHVDICGLLGIQRGLIALSRVDLVDPDFLSLARDDVASLVAGTFLEHAPVVSFSIHDPHAAERVAGALDEVLRHIARPDFADRPFLLAVDRAFSRPGFGTVVTGTSRAGVVSVGDEVLVHRLRAAPIAARVRGLELHGESVARAACGQRVAINLAGVSAAEVERGARVCHAGPAELAPGSLWDVAFEALGRLPVALPDGEKGLACFGATVVEATLGLLDRAAIAPGEQAFAQLRLAEPLALLAGERWIFRGFRDFPGNAATLGGGRVLAPSPRRRRRERANMEASAGPARAREPAGRHLDSGSAQPASASLAAIGGDDLGLAIDAYVASAGESGVARRHLHAALPWPRAAIDAAVDSSTLIRIDAGAASTLVSARSLASATRAIDAALELFHASEPAANGLTAEALRTRVRPSSSAPVFQAILESLVAAGKLAQDGSVFARVGFAPATSANEDALDAAVLAEITRADLMPPRVDELGRRLAPLFPGLPQVAIDAAVVRLVAAGKLARVQKDTAFAVTALSELESRVRGWFVDHEWLDAQALKEITGATRKWSIPLGEWLDRQRVTVRVQDRRRLRA